MGKETPKKVTLEVELTGEALTEMSAAMMLEEQRDMTEALLAAISLWAFVMNKKHKIESEGGELVAASRFPGLPLKEAFLLSTGKRKV